MMDTAMNESALLAKEKGMFPKCVPQQVLDSPFFKENASEETRKLVAEYGLRNSQLLTIAPTGSLSTMIGISGGIEPIFAISYMRRTTSLSDHDDYYKVYTPIVQSYLDTHPEIENDEDLPGFFVTAQNLDYNNRIDMQATWQKHIDASISSTVNLPVEFPEKDVYNIYMKAWESGCKGVTVFRDGCKRLGILSTEEKKEETTPDKQESRGIVEEVSDSVIGKKRKLMTGCGSLHCTAFFDPVTGELKEAYLNKGSTGGCNNFMVGLSRMISLAARSGCGIDRIVDQLKSCGSCPSYVVRTHTQRDTSRGSCCPMAVGWALMDMYKEMQSQIRGIPEEAPEEEQPREIRNPCPKCGAELEFQGGCNVCKSCGWTKCE